MNSIPEDKDYKDFLNPESLTVAKGYAEPALLDDGGVVQDDGGTLCPESS